MVVRPKVRGNGHSFWGERRSSAQLARSYFLHQGLTLERAPSPTGLPVNPSHSFFRRELGKNYQHLKGTLNLGRPDFEA